MSTRSTKQKLLQNRMHRIRPLLSAEEPFCVQDFDRDQIQDDFRMLAENGVIEQVDRIYDGENHYIQTWQWVGQWRDELMEYLDRRDEFPCGHRVHIYNDRETPEGCLGCGKCAELGQHPEYSKEFVRGLL